MRYGVLVLMVGRTYKVLEKNGSVFIKLGQHLAAMGYLLPYEWTVCCAAEVWQKCAKCRIDYIRAASGSVSGEQYG
jgi:aarF domain-containing kinase